MDHVDQVLDPVLLGLERITTLDPVEDMPPGNVAEVTDERLQAVVKPMPHVLLR